ncbi:MAG: YqgE/AlgH family protein [Sphingomonas fennica]
MDAETSLAGRLLLALPGIGEPEFDQAVIAMCLHDEDGALGIGIGHLIEGIGLHGLMAQLAIPPGRVPDVPLHRGGPVERQRGFVLHSREWQGEDTIDVAGRWALTGTLDVLRALAHGTGPARWLVALGYAGWSDGQLEAELARPGWLAAAGDDAIVFDAAPADRWQATLKGEGIDPRLLVGAGGHA